MKKLVLALAAFICGVLSAGVIRIMPLGDSITDGVGAAGGYRLPLYNLLTQANYTVDYVGSMRDNGAPDMPFADMDGQPSGNAGQGGSASGPKDSLTAARSSETECISFRRRRKTAAPGRPLK